MDRLIRRSAALLAVLVVCVGCAVAEPPTTLRVALFPYIPDAANDQFAGMRQRLKTEFEAEHPGVRLTLDPIDIHSEVCLPPDILNERTT